MLHKTKRGRNLPALSYKLITKTIATMKRAKLPFVALVSILLISMTSCDKDAATEPGYVSLCLHKQTVLAENGLRSATTATPVSLLLTIKDAFGKTVINAQKYPIITVNDEYWVQNIEFASGSYTIEDFMVLDSSEQVIYLAPKSGSELAAYVNRPLPFSFTVTGGQSTNISLEVLDTNLGSLSDFGYASFSYDVFKLLTLQPGPEAGKDAHVEAVENRYDLKSPNYPYLHLFAWTINGDLAVVRSFLAFDLSPIPTGSQVLKARLSLYEYHKEGAAISEGHSHVSGSNAFQLRRVTESWQENTICWNNQPTTTTEHMVTAPQDTSASQDYVNIDVTNMVQYWVNNPTANHGILLKLVDEWPYRSILFATSDCPIAEKRPKLVVSYK